MRLGEHPVEGLVKLILGHSSRLTGVAAIGPNRYRLRTRPREFMHT